MSASSDQTTSRFTVPEITARKGGTPLVTLTAYTAPMARLLDPHVDILLVGDSVGMVLYGMDTTLSVDLTMMINHTKAVMRGSHQACVVVDMPFGTYEESPQQAFQNAARLMRETGCAAVKLEGGEEMAETVSFLTKRGIPVMGHVGLMPQQVQALGGFKAQGKDDQSAHQVIEDATAIAGAGAFSLVIEGVMEPVARKVTEIVKIPTIGIGASPACDGQVLVTEDILGLFAAFKPKFVKRYTDLSDDVSNAVASYAEEVRQRQFPDADHCFGMTQKNT